ncbi:MspA family porin [Tsukamurella hominis]|uniref:MspA family porin n=1 Tax=Tsukamurella hominis TaxID=1970232 RepID=UPI0039E8E020
MTSARLRDRQNTGRATCLAATPACILAVAAGTFAAAPQAVAAPTPMKDTQISRTTKDGWKVRIQLQGVEVNPVSNLAGTPTSREAFFKATAVGSVDGAGSSPIEGASMALIVQIGCAVDVASGVAVGGGVSATVGPSVSVSPALSIAGGSLNVGAGVGAGVGAAANVATVIKPGGIATSVVRKKTIAKNRAGVSVEGVHVKVDGCAGNVGVRIGAGITMSSSEFDNEVFTYSASLPI